MQNSNNTDEINDVWFDENQNTPIDTSFFFDVDCFSPLICCCFYNDPILTLLLKFFTLPSLNHILDKGCMWCPLIPLAICVDIFMIIFLIFMKVK